MKCEIITMYFGKRICLQNDCFSTVYKSSCLLRVKNLLFSGHPV